MSTQLLLGANAALLLACIGLLILLLRRTRRADGAQIDSRLALLGDGQQRAERAVREEMALSRDEAGRAGTLLREEVGASIGRIGDQVFQHLGVLSTRQTEQLAQVMEALQLMTESGQAGARQLREEVGATLERLRGTVEGRLDQIRQDNTAQLEQVRQTVDEKLHGVLEQRLGESFSLVSERLELVHRGLGEMQTLASGVGDLKKVLQNVKVRGTWGEVQLGRLLEQVLSADQYAANVMTNEHHGGRVEFAIRLPGHDLGPVWLPIDAKFPLEDYQRLVDAQEAGDVEGMEAASRALEQRIRASAREICLKYLNPPQTTDFAILFLPTEGLYAEVVRRSGLVDAVQRESRVVVAGPITLWAILNSLQMGFRTLAIQQRSSEVWKVLGSVKTEFGRFGEVLEKVQKKLQSATNEMERAGVRTRAIQKTLREVEEVPPPEARRLLAIDGLTLSDAESGDEAVDVAAD